MCESAHFFVFFFFPFDFSRLSMARSFSCSGVRFLDAELSFVVLSLFFFVASEALALLSESLSSELLLLLLFAFFFLALEASA